MASLRFLANWSEEQDGDVRAGETLEIHYDPTRLPNCRSSRYGRPAWSIVGFVRFHPGLQEQSAAVVPGPFEVTVPPDATRVEMWFKNTDQTGCVAWDSRYCQNYWWDITR